MPTISVHTNYLLLQTVFSQTHRIAKAGQQHWGLPSLIPQLRAGQTEEIAEGHVHLGSEQPQGWRYTSSTSSEHSLFHFLTTFAK